MRVLLAVLFLLGVLGSAHAEPTAIPEFTPNIVDPGNVLDAAGKEAVNAAIQRVRDESKVWGAVYIVGSLGDESIEELAVRAFEKWQLGQAGVDNGLLLVLAMQDRKSRFEVGYGLEGTITDVAALHALDAYLAPKMRTGDTAGAIVDAFGYLSRLVAQDPVAVEELATVVDQTEDWSRGLRAWVAFLIPVWLGAPFYRWWLAMRRRWRSKATTRWPTRRPQPLSRRTSAVSTGGRSASACSSPSTRASSSSCSRPSRRRSTTARWWCPPPWSCW